MPRRRPTTHALRLVLLAALLLFGAHAARAAHQTFVSAKGDDAAACDQAAPCRTFAGALVKTNNRGEVAVLDSGEYGHFTVTGSVKVTAVGVYAGVTVFDADGVTLKPSASSEIALRGLTISGTSSSRGIVYEGPTYAREGEPTAALHVEGCTFANLSIAGISFKGNGDLFVKDTTIRNVNGSGIEVFAAQGQKTRATVVNTRLEKSDTGLRAHGDGSVLVTARDTIAAGNKTAGFLAHASSSAGVRVQLQGCVATGTVFGVRVYDWARVTVEGCTLTNNESGILTNHNGEVRLSNTTITDNGIGIQNIILVGQGTYGNVVTFGNNRLFGNNLNTLGKSSVDALPY